MVGEAFKIVEIGLLRSDAEEPDDLNALLTKGADQRDFIDQRREAGQPAAGVQHGMPAVANLLGQPRLNPFLPVGETADRRRRGVVKES